MVREIRGTQRRRQHRPTAIPGDLRPPPAKSRGLLGWAVSLYVATTLIEGSVLSLGTSRISRFMAAALIVLVLIYAMSNKIPKFTNKVIIGICGIFALVLGSFLWSDVPEQAFTRPITFGALAATSIALAAAFAYLADDAVKAVQSGLILGALTASLLVVVARIEGDFAGPEDFQEIMMRSSAGAADPNDLGLLIAAAIPACIWARQISVRVLVSALGVTAVLFTGSRGAILALAVGATTALVVTIITRGGKAFPSVVRTAAVATVVVWIVWNFLPEAIADRIRGVPAELSSGTFTHRMVLWEAAWNEFGESPILGTGTGTIRHYINQRTGFDLVAHNTHLSFLVELGVLGWVLFAFALVVGWIGAIKVTNEFIWPVITLAILTTGTLSLSWEFNKLLWVILVFGGYLAVYWRTSDDRANSSTIVRREIWNSAKRRVG